MDTRIVRSYLLMITLWLGILSPRDLWAVPSVNAQSLQPAIGHGNALSVEGTETAEPWYPILHGWLDAAYKPLVVIDESRGSIASIPVPHMSTFHLIGGLGFTDWFQLGFDIPLVLFQGEPVVVQTGAESYVTSPFGFGDIRLVGKFRLLDNQNGGFGIAIVPQVLFPSGSPYSFRGAGALQFEPFRMSFEYRKTDAWIAVNASVLFRTEDQVFQQYRISHQFRYGLAGYLPFDFGFGMFGELVGSVGLVRHSGMRYSPLETSVGLRWRSESTGIELNAGFSVQLIATPGFGHRFFTGISWLPKSPPQAAPPAPPLDSDQDGIFDEDDACPYDAGPIKLKGCPDKDRDDVPDRKDACPDEPGLVTLDGCPDRDSDGVPDRRDLCPDSPGPVELQGCPDQDKDAVLDKDDACPDVAGLPELQGCPDQDKDGIPDLEDKCPEIPGPKPTGCPLVKKIHQRD